MLPRLSPEPSSSTVPSWPGAASTCAAFLLGVVYAAVSAYWGLGGTALLDTVGGTLEREARAGSASLLAVIWLTVALKLLVAVLGLEAAVGHHWIRPSRHQWARRAAWAAAVTLVLYGGVLTITGLLVQSGLVPAAAHADRKALRWHAYLWDPWFLVWGLLLVVGLARSCPGRSKQPTEASP